MSRALNADTTDMTKSWDRLSCAPRLLHPYFWRKTHSRQTHVGGSISGLDYDAMPGGRVDFLFSCEDRYFYMPEKGLE